MAENPFKPTAGKMPPILIGRQATIADFVEGLENGAGAPGRLMLVTGQRGFGKTVMLTEFRRLAHERGWVAIADTASEGLCERLVNTLSGEKARFSGATFDPTIGIAGVVSARLGQASFTAGEAPLTLRRAIERRLADRKIEPGKGILFTIDETQAASRDDLVAIATAVQHVIADEDLKDIPDTAKKGVAFVFAGLPSLVDEVVNDRVLTFLRRSLRRELGEVPIPDVKNAFVETVNRSGKSLDERSALKAARLTDGYPYMIQLVGYYMWQRAERRDLAVISEEDVRGGYQDALLAFGDAVCAPALDGLTPAARELAVAMAQDDPTPSKVADLAERLGKSSSWVSKYRASLIRERVARPAGRGLLTYAIPHLGDYIRAQGLGGE